MAAFRAYEKQSNGSLLLLGVLGEYNGRDASDNPIFTDLSLTNVDEGSLPLTPLPPVLSGTLVSRTNASLNWTAPNNTGRPPITEYRIYRSDDGGAETYVDTVSASTFVYSNTPLPVNTPEILFRFTVRAVNADGVGDASNIISMQYSSTPVQGPTAPTGLGASQITATSARLTWTETFDASVTKHGIFKGNTLVVDNLDATAVTYLWSGLASGVQQVNVNVRRYNSAVGWSPASNMITFTPTAQVTRMIVLSEAQGSAAQSFGQLDARIAARVGTTTPLLAGRHDYSGATFPSSFASSKMQSPYNAGYRYGMLNVKTGANATDWITLANGTHDAKIRAWPATIPSGFKLYMCCDHEPENADNAPAHAAEWCAGQARMANIIAEMNDDRLHYVVCHMAYTFEPGSTYPNGGGPRNPDDWNPWPLMTPAARARTIFGPDGYNKLNNLSGTSYSTMDAKLGVAFTKAVQWGAQRFAISEHILNNDVGASGAVCAAHWTNHILPWIRARDFVYYALYNHTGAAAGTNSYIDTPEEEAVIGNFALEYKP